MSKSSALWSHVRVALIKTEGMHSNNMPMPSLLNAKASLIDKQNKDFSQLLILNTSVSKDVVYLDLRQLKPFCRLRTLFEVQLLCVV